MKKQVRAVQTKDPTTPTHLETKSEHPHGCKELRRTLSNAARIRWRLASENSSNHFSDDEEHPGRKAIKLWFAPLISKSQWSLSEEKPLSKELALLSKMVASIVEAEESNILTEEEAEAVTRFLVAKFLERRFDKTLRELLNVSEKHWFLAASRYLHE